MKPSLLTELPPHAAITVRPALLPSPPGSSGVWSVSETWSLSMEMAGVLEIGASLHVVLTVGGFEEPKLGMDPLLREAEFTLSRVFTFHPETGSCRRWSDVFVSV